MQLAETIEQLHKQYAEAQLQLLGKIEDPGQKKKVTRVIDMLNRGIQDFENTDPVELQRIITAELAKEH
jgi:hypothetical protein